MQTNNEQKPDLETVSNDQLLDELAKRLDVDAHDLRNKLTIVVCRLQLERVKEAKR